MICLDFDWQIEEFAVYCHSTQLRENPGASYEQTRPCPCLRQTSPGTLLPQYRKGTEILFPEILSRKFRLFSLVLQKSRRGFLYPGEISLLEEEGDLWYHI